jgi:c-di-GMP-binding flagellar brake protein YcgR
VTEQRRSQRYDVEWACRYRLTRRSPWRPCRLIDVSDTGAAFEPYELLPDETPVGEIELMLSSPSGSPDPFRLIGQVRHLTRTSLGRTRVGIRFTEVDEHERERLRELAEQFL